MPVPPFFTINYTMWPQRGRMIASDVSLSVCGSVHKNCKHLLSGTTIMLCYLSIATLDPVQKAAMFVERLTTREKTVH